MCSGKNLQTSELLHSTGLNAFVMSCPFLVNTPTGYWASLSLYIIFKSEVYGKIRTCDRELIWEPGKLGLQPWLFTTHAMCPWIASSCIVLRALSPHLGKRPMTLTLNGCYKKRVDDQFSILPICEYLTKC